MDRDTITTLWIIGYGLSAHLGGIAEQGSIEWVLLVVVVLVTGFTATSRALH